MPPPVPEDIWQCQETRLVVTAGARNATIIWLAEARDAAEHPTMRGAVPHETMNYLARNVNSARLRNSNLGQHGFIGGFMNI